MDATEKLARFVIDTGYEGLPADVITSAKHLILDAAGVTLAAYDDTPSTIVQRFVASLGASPRATVLGTRIRTSIPDAAFANGVMAHALEFDDSTLSPVGHPGCTVFPAVFSLCEALHLDGKKLLEAYVLGLEVHGKLGAAQKTLWDFESGWLPIGTVGLVAAAVACAKLLDCTVEQARVAMGLAAHMSGQLNVNSGTMAKPLGAGHSARNAIVAAFLARDGFTADDSVLERKGGFADLFFGKGNHDLSKATASLGNPYHILAPGIAVKRYPSCYACHWGVDALLELIQEHSLTPEKVAAIELRYPKAAAFVDDPNPDTPQRAKFSHQYNLAAALVDGDLTVDSFSEKRIGDPRIRAALSLVKATMHPEGTPPPECWSYPVTVRTKDGRTLTTVVKWPRGHPKNPMSLDDIRAKYRKCARRVLSSQGVEKSLEQLVHLERQKDVAKVAALLVPS